MLYYKNKKHVFIHFFLFFPNFSYFFQEFGILNINVCQKVTSAAHFTNAEFIHHN